eukprot:936431-Pelagomonas_calceolata.AAC.4
MQPLPSDLQQLPTPHYSKQEKKQSKSSTYGWFCIQIAASPGLYQCSVPSVSVSWGAGSPQPAC